MDRQTKVRKKREENKFLQAEEIIAFRKITGLSQIDAAKLFGGGVRAFYKYEKEEQCQNKPLDILMRLILRDKISLDDIRSLKE